MIDVPLRNCPPRIHPLKSGLSVLKNATECASPLTLTVGPFSWKMVTVRPHPTALGLAVPPATSRPTLARCNCGGGLVGNQDDIEGLIQITLADIGINETRIRNSVLVEDPACPPLVH